MPYLRLIEFGEPWTKIFPLDMTITLILVIRAFFGGYSSERASASSRWCVVRITARLSDRMPSMISHMNLRF